MDEHIAVPTMLSRPFGTDDTELQWVPVWDDPMRDKAEIELVWAGSAPDYKVEQLPGKNGGNHAS